MVLYFELYHIVKIRLKEKSQNMVIFTIVTKIDIVKNFKFVFNDLTSL